MNPTANSSFTSVRVFDVCRQSPSFVPTIVAALILSMAAPPQARSGGTVVECTEASLTNAIAGGGTVTFACDGVIAIDSTIVISADTTIDGAGRSVAIDGQGTVRLFQVNSGIQLGLLNLTLANGRHVGAERADADGEPGFGGAILNSGGNVSLVSCALTNNAAVGGRSTGLTGHNGGGALGGAILCVGGALNITNSSFVGNSTLGGTGAVVPFSAGGRGGDGVGGAICSQGGNLAMDGVVLDRNLASGAIATIGSMRPGDGWGGALHCDQGAVAVAGCTFRGNSAAGGGAFGFTGGPAGRAGTGTGGALSISNASLVCRETVFLTNRATGGYEVRYGGAGESKGGGAFCGGGVELIECLFEGNVANNESSGVKGGDSKGGALFVASTTAVTRSLFRGNIAHGGLGLGVGTPSATAFGGDGVGGAIYNDATLTLTNSTLIGNLALGGPGSAFGTNGSAAGGAYFSGASSTAYLVNLTVSENNARPGPTTNAAPGTAAGGGFHATNGSVQLYNSILAHSGSSSNCFGTIGDGGYNLSSDSSCSFSSTGSLNDADPKLAPLSDYGGPTLTAALLEGSPAIDGASTANCPGIDQRGRPRPFGMACDIGAFESSPPFTIRGSIEGYLQSSNGISVTAGAASGVVDSAGGFRIDGLAPGSYLIQPGAEDVVFVQSNKLVNLGPDIVGLSFHSYRSNAFTIALSEAGELLPLIFAGATGDSWAVSASTNAVEWVPLTTNIVTASGLFEIPIPLDPSVMFFKGERQ